MTDLKTCRYCQKPLIGRVDKKFCDSYCRATYHAKKIHDNEPTFFKTVDRQLKRNRKLLMHFNRSGKSTIRKEKLIQAGFNPNYFTHYWKNNNNQVYLFCYEYGFLRKTEHGIKKYLLIKWQSFMSNSHR